MSAPGMHHFIAALCHRLSRERRGTSALEFAFVAPLLFLLLLGIIQFGLTLNNYEVLTGGTQAAARQFAVSRGSDKPSTSATNALYSAAPNLTQTKLSIKLLVDGAQCSTGGASGDGACQTALAAGQGKPATVTTSYPCSLSFFGYDFASPCTLTSQMTESVE